MNLNTTLIIPADVPKNKYATFTKNYNTLTRGTGRLFLFSCDHKIEHLNRDFYGQNISPQALHPEHMFRIASQGNIGAMATHLGLIARYAKNHTNVNYVVKLNGTTNLSHNNHDQKSLLLCNIENVLSLKNNNPSLSIPGIGITLYLGNEYESEMLAQTAQTITKAHQEGLVTIVWIYLRGKAITQENNPELIAGAAGIGTSLGADFIKIKPPAPTEVFTNAQNLKIASAAAGNSKIICSGGEKLERDIYLKTLYDQIHTGDAAGTATGRNIFQLPLQEAIALTHAISSLVYNNSDYKIALACYESEIQKKSS